MCMRDGYVLFVLQLLRRSGRRWCPWRCSRLRGRRWPVCPATVRPFVRRRCPRSPRRARRAPRRASSPTRWTPRRSRRASTRAKQIWYCIKWTFCLNASYQKYTIHTVQTTSYYGGNLIFVHVRYLLVRDFLDILARILLFEY